MVRTKRWTRSPRGEIFGVATGLAEWRDLPPAATRLVVFLLIFFTGIFPGAAIYFFLAVILPKQSEADIIADDAPRSSMRFQDPVMDARFNESKGADREKDWDERFRNS